MDDEETLAALERSWIQALAYLRDREPLWCDVDQAMAYLRGKPGILVHGSLVTATRTVSTFERSAIDYLLRTHGWEFVQRDGPYAFANAAFLLRPFWEGGAEDGSSLTVVDDGRTVAYKPLVAVGNFNQNDPWVDGRIGGLVGVFDDD